jgi:hypothetical protein
LTKLPCYTDAHELSTLIRPAGHLPLTLGEGVLTHLLRIVYEIIFSNAPKTPLFC